MEDFSEEEGLSLGRGGGQKSGKKSQSKEAEKKNLIKRRRNSTSDDESSEKSSSPTSWCVTLLMIVFMILFVTFASLWATKSTTTPEVNQLVVNAENGSTLFLSDLPVSSIFNPFFLQSMLNITLYNVANLSSANGTNTTLVLQVVTSTLNEQWNNVNVTTIQNVTVEIFANGTVFFNDVLYQLIASSSSPTGRHLLASSNNLPQLNMSIATSCPVRSLPHTTDVGNLQLNIDGVNSSAYCKQSDCVQSCRIPTQLNVTRCESITVLNNISSVCQNGNSNRAYICNIAPYPPLRACSSFCPEACSPWVQVNSTLITYTAAKILLASSNPTFLLDGSESTDDNEYTVIYRCAPYDAHATCAFQNGRAVCDCESGWTRSDSTDFSMSTVCVDINECLDSPCSRGQVCRNTPGSYECECPTLSGKYIVDSDTGASECVFIDACSLDSAVQCVSPATCITTSGQSSCICPNGYSLSEDQLHCNDINECNQENVHTLCPGNETCRNTIGSYRCECSATNGMFVINTSTGASQCVAIDACSLNNRCVTPAMCVSSNGVASCSCPPSGYILSTNQTTCLDINECTGNSPPCSASATCVNTPGSYTCTCNTNFNGDGIVCVPGCGIGFNMSFDVNHENGTCVDINECQFTTYNQCNQTRGPFSHCVNTNGGYTCNCNSGYNGSWCTLICPTGFIPNGAQTSCVDENECLVSPPPCDIYATCTNTNGSFNCNCNGGFIGDGYHCGLFCPQGYDLVNNSNAQCVDIDECLSNTSRCDATSTTCVNVPGSYLCNCNDGYHAPDECGLDSTLAACVINCDGGYQPSEDNTNCVDVNECNTLTRACDPNAQCSNTIGSYTCACNDGYDGDGQACAKQCDYGFTYVSNDITSCVDVNECLWDQNPCSPQATCNNIDGSYTCTCNDGYDGDGVTCIIICTDGHKPNGSNPTQCIDINECTQDPRPCDPRAQCTNTDGSYTCACFDGYDGDGISCAKICSEGYVLNVSDDNQCIDEDECVTLARACDPMSRCINTDGGYDCAGCGDGFIGNGLVCVADCQPGYRLNSSDTTQCIDINECESDITLFCDPNYATCNNTQGSYQCLCNAGYEGDGCTCTFMVCSTGSYNTATFGVYECAVCPIGTYQDSTGTTQCNNCDFGYTTAGNGSTSSDNCTVIIDNCAVLGENATCQANSHCLSTIGYLTYDCPCDGGYILDTNNNCVITANCTVNTCDENHVCIAFEDGGFVPASSASTDVPELCVCAPGLATAEDPSSCYSCGTGTYQDLSGITYNDPTTTCTLCPADTYQPNIQSTTCLSCDTCYTSGTGASSCDPIDQCDIDNSCDQNAGCVNDVESEGCYYCNCNINYYGNGFTCNACSNGAITLEVGSSGCTCDYGYYGDGNTCTACPEFFTTNDYGSGSIESCVAISRCDGFCGDNTDCTENVNYTTWSNSPICTCSDGYTDGGNVPYPYTVGCTAIDYCSSPELNNCDPNARCFSMWPMGDSPDRWECNCNDGYTGNGTVCTDVDECQLGGAVVLQYRYNSMITGVLLTDPGAGYMLVNAPEFNNGHPDQSISLLQFNVVDANGMDQTSTFEYMSSTFMAGNPTIRFTYPGQRPEVNFVTVTAVGINGDPPVIAIALDPTASYGTSINGFNQNDLFFVTFIPAAGAPNWTMVPDCATGAYCTNTPGSFECTCNISANYYGNDGFTACIVGQTCSEEIPCVNNNSQCELLVTNTICLCNAGYAGNGVTCTQCGTGFYSPNDTVVSCLACAPGYTSSSPYVDCVDINECLDPYSCNSAATCTNTQGSYSCNCNSGYSGDGFDCIPIRMKMFITDNLYAANFTSVDNANTICQAEAVNAGLDMEADHYQIYRAWISNEISSPANNWTEFHQSPGNTYSIVMYEGGGVQNVLFANNFTDMTNLVTSVKFNKTVSNHSLSTVVFLWTATLANGTFSGTISNGGDCNSWTSTSSGLQAVVGFNGLQLNGVTAYWTNSLVNSPQTACGPELHRLYCIQQPMLEVPT